jgi:dihydroorotate dehydrogenase
VRNSTPVWYRAIRPALFAFDPERAHQLALNALRVAGQGAMRVRSGGSIECMGLRFPNRVGLAAGFDKNASALDGLGRLGFGFIEVGTVTPRAQSGQPRPRLFRLGTAEALINRLGFPNDGADKVAARLRRRAYRGVVGVNIGKNATTPLARAIDDYLSCLRTMHQVADYIVVNVSSPNTAGLRELQARDLLEPLLSALLEERLRSANTRAHALPLLLKIAPDLADSEVQEIAALLKRLPLDGVVATNTTLSREGLRGTTSAPSGGMSGRPLRPLALRIVANLRASLGRDFPIIGVGGIDSATAALAMRAAGADLIQVYTGLIYRGPALVSQCIRALQSAAESPPGN